MRKHNRWLRSAAALFAGGWAIALTSTPSAMAGTLPSADAPPVSTTTGWVEVSNAAQLEYIDQNQSTYLSSNIELMNNINLSGYAGWVPLGGNSYSTFSGTFNGQGHEITGLTITDSTPTDGRVGFFGTVSGTIENLGLNATVLANTGALIGGLTGELDGSISNSYFTGSVTDNAGGLNHLDGGLVGYADGYFSVANITNSYSTASVTNTGTTGQVGGLVGETMHNCTISNSYATGLLTGAHGGGLSGGSSTGTTITASFFDMSTTNQNYPVSNWTSTVGAESHTWMQTPSNFTTAGWSTSNWVFYPGQYPQLAWQVPPQPQVPFSVGANFVWNGQYGVPYVPLQLQAISGYGPYEWSVVSGSLPSGLSLSSDGVITGTPNGPDRTSTFTVKVKDANGQTATATLNILIWGTPSLAVTIETMPVGHVGQSYSAQLQATGVNPITWTLQSGSLPSGLNLNSSGSLSGIPTQSGSFVLNVQVTDASGVLVQSTVILDVKPLGPFERLISWNGETRTVPAMVRNNTTYMPIWYVMQYLKLMDIQSAWDGQNWRMTTQSTPKLAGVSVGNGNTSMYLDGTLVQKVNTVAALDPSTGGNTTYMPIWYVMQLLQRMGLQSTWDGTTWMVK